MSPKERARARPDKMTALLSSGDHREAARVARALLADPGVSAEERARASSVMASLAPEKVASIAGILGVVVAVAITIWACLGGGQ